MGHLADGNDMFVSADELQAFAWSAPMRELAAKVGMSDVGLKKLLTARGIATPPQGHWNSGATARPAPARPRRPGETGRIRVDARFKGHVSPAAPMASSGPFASALVPECLEHLYEQELAAIGSAAVPRSLEQPHRGLSQILRQEQRRADSAGERVWSQDGPRFDTPLGKRRLRLLNGYFLALAGRGHDGDVSERNRELHARATIGDTHVEIEVTTAGKCRMVHQAGRLVPAPDLPASTPLRLRLCSEPGASGSWQDDAKGSLESKIAAIAAATIVAGERRFRDNLREAEDRAERERAQQELLRQKEIASRNEERLQSLHASAELLRQAQDLRAVVAGVRAAVERGGLEVDPEVFSAWLGWALSEADRIDPVISGQVLSHLTGQRTSSSNREFLK